MNNRVRIYDNVIGTTNNTHEHVKLNKTLI